MSKLQRKPVQKPTFDEEIVSDLHESVNVHPPDCDVPHCPCGNKGGRVVSVNVSDLAKVMVADATPRCPNCGSVKIQLSQPVMGMFNRWSCTNCQTSFRDPVTKERAA